MTVREGRGMVLGKFLPPHAGHVYLVEFAQRFCADLTVVVGTLAREPIPGELRVAWMRELFPGARVVHHTDENPQEPHEHPDFWRLWRESLLRVLPAPPDYVFASEPYGARLAQELGARFVPVDLPRGAVPVSGTAIRQDPLANWRFLPRVVRPHFARRISIFGPESTGKSVLAQELARCYQTTWVPEYARSWLEARGPGAVTLADIEAIARGQLASEEALAREANRLLVCDTDLLATTLWSDLLLGSCPDWIRAAAQARRYDLTLLCEPSVPFVPDPIRYRPNERAAFFARCEALLAAAGRPTLVLRGTWDERRQLACTAIDALLAAGARTP